jgi:transposase
VHKAAGLREFAASQDWLTLYYLPAYAPDLNTVDGVWSLPRRGWLSNVSFTTRNTSSSVSDAAYATSNTAATS